MTTEQPASPRQTVTYLRQLFAAHGIRPKNKLGQNFLIDLNVVDFVVRSAELTPEDLAVEVGTGTGGLTARLVESAGAVLSVEIDPAFHQLAQETVNESDRVVLLNADILENKNRLNPEVLAALDRMRQTPGVSRLKLVRSEG